jgi:hypothetical protein
MAFGLSLQPIITMAALLTILSNSTPDQQIASSYLASLGTPLPPCDLDLPLLELPKLITPLPPPGYQRW